MMMKSSTIHFRHRIASGNQAPCSQSNGWSANNRLVVLFFTIQILIILFNDRVSLIRLQLITDFMIFCVYCFHSFLFEISLPLNTPIEQWTSVENNVIKLRKCVSTKESLARYLVISLRTIKKPSACFWLT